MRKWRSFFWTWLVFWEGWLFGRFLGWTWAVVWFAIWLAARAGLELGRWNDARS